jgi:hypothetical protein
MAFVLDCHISVECDNPACPVFLHCIAVTCCVGQRDERLFSMRCAQQRNLCSVDA